MEPDQRCADESAAMPAALGDVGQFWYYFDEDRWEWSDDVARIHGYASAADVAPTTELMIEHKHPDDKARIQELIHRMRTTKEAFSSTHRIVTTGGETVPVMVVADVVLDEDRRRIGTAGYYVVLSSDPGSSAEAAHDNVWEQVEEVVYHRAVIEQAKGVLKFVYRLDDEQAFDLLRWRSQVTNTKIRDLSGAICSQLSAISLPPDVRTQFDHMLLTVHEQLSHDS
jgi:hypothetical protein